MDDDDKVPTPDKWIDGLDGDEVQLVVETLASVDPTNPELSGEQRDLVTKAREVWNEFV